MKQSNQPEREKNKIINNINQNHLISKQIVRENPF